LDDFGQSCAVILSEAKDPCSLRAAGKLQRSFAAMSAAQDDKTWSERGGRCSPGDG